MTKQMSEKEPTQEERQFQETKVALEKEIHKRFVKELVLRSQRQTTTQEQQSYLEQLYFDLKFINPDLAFATLKASALITARAHELQQAQIKHEEEKKLKKAQEESRKQKKPAAESTSDEKEDKEKANKESKSKRKHSSSKSKPPPVSSSKSKSKQQVSESKAN